jgi:hypothetical protein
LAYNEDVRTSYYHLIIVEELIDTEGWLEEEVLPFVQSHVLVENRQKLIVEDVDLLTAFTSFHFD